MKKSEAIEIVKKLDGMTYTKKDLVEFLGFTQYIINELLEKGMIIYEKRNSYTFKYVELKEEKPKKRHNDMTNSKQRKALYADFKSSVRIGSYGVSYMDLKKYIENYSQNDTVLAYALLLEMLLFGKNYDFSFIDKSIEREIVITEGYARHFDDFVDFLLHGNLKQACASFKKFKAGEIAAMEENSEDTLLMELMIEDVLKLEEKKKNFYLSDVFDIFKEYDRICKSKNYQEALDFIQKYKEKKYIKLLIELTKSLINLSNNKKYYKTQKNTRYPSQMSSKEQFRYAININDYKTALRLASIIRLDSDDKLVMDIFYKRIEEAILLNEENRNSHFEEIKMQKNKDASEKEKKEYYSKLYNLFLIESYQEAIDFIEKQGRNPDSIIDTIETYTEIVNFLKYIKNGKNSYVVYNYNYQGLNANEKFEKAITLSDYKNALFFMKDIDFEGNDVYLIYQLLLNRIKEYTSLCISPQREKKEYKIVASKIKSNVISLEEVSEYLNLKKYDELYNLLDEKKLKYKREGKRISKHEFMIISLLRIWNDVNNGKYYEKNTIYRNQNILDVFYEALRCKDLEELKRTIESFRKYNFDFDNIDCYENIINDIYDLIDIKKIDEKINLLIIKPVLNITDYNYLEELLLEKYEITNNILYYDIRCIVDMIKTAKNSYIDETYFEDLIINEQDPCQKLLCYLNNGSYHLAINLIDSVDYTNGFDSISENDFKLIKKLLFVLKSKMNHEQAKIELEFNGEIAKVDSLTQLEKLIQVEDYYAAFKFALENDINGDMLGYLYFLFSEVINMEEILYKNYKDSILTKDRKQIQESIDEYTKFINKSSLLNKKEIEKKFKRMK